MSKFREKLLAQNLRKKGQSINDIAKRLKVSKGTVSVWCRDIHLSKIQIEKLNQKMVAASYYGRLKGAHIQQAKRIAKINYWDTEGLKIINSISKRELLFLGLGLYWGEGTKKDNKVIFSNSDPNIIKLIIKWFEKILNVQKKDLVFQIGINEIHKNRIHEVKNYWRKITNCSITQFGKPSLKKVKNKKIYKNTNEHYGTLRISVHRSSGILYRIMGLLKAINKAA